MSDDGHSASDLRKMYFFIFFMETSRYQQGGTIPDDQLTASQLRARAGIVSNKKGFFLTYCFSFYVDWSTKSEEGSSGVMIIVVILLLALIGAGLFFFVKGKSHEDL